MQIVPPQPLHFLPLLALLPLALAQAHPLHLFLFALLLLFRPAPSQNYCNAIASLLLCMLIGLDNLQLASVAISE